LRCPSPLEEIPPDFRTVDLSECIYTHMSKIRCYSLLLPSQERGCCAEQSQLEQQQQLRAAQEGVERTVVTQQRARTLLGAARKLASTFRGKAAASLKPRGRMGVSSSPKFSEENPADRAGHAAVYDEAMQMTSQSGSRAQSNSFQDVSTATLWRTQFSGMSCRRKRVSK
jgi:hypothetical protein